jgi:hypothetical protein
MVSVRAIRLNPFPEQVINSISSMLKDVLGPRLGVPNVASFLPTSIIPDPMVGPIRSDSTLLVGDMICQKKGDHIAAMYLIQKVELSHIIVSVLYDHYGSEPRPEVWMGMPLIFYSWFDDFINMNAPFYLVARDDVLPKEV